VGFPLSQFYPKTREDVASETFVLMVVVVVIVVVDSVIWFIHLFSKTSTHFQQMNQHTWYL
jgi:type II secretory pathway component PulK